MAGGREAADRVGRDAAERGSVGAVPAGRDQSDAVLRLEKATAVLGDAGFRCCRRQAQCLGGEEGGGAAADERRGGGDHRGEPGAKKRALGLEDYGQLPPELQKRVHEEVKQARQRSGWPAKKTLAALGIPRRSYYRWLREEAWARVLPTEPVKPVQPYEALPEEKEAVLDYARRHPELRHREMAWRMVDEDVVYLSPSTVYRILKSADLVCPWRRRTKRRRAEEEKATRPNQRWATDVMQVMIGALTYFVVSFMDEYSRYVVHFEIAPGMDGITVGTAAQAAIDTLPKGADGRPVDKPEIRSAAPSCGSCPSPLRAVR